MQIKIESNIQEISARLEDIAMKKLPWALQRTVNDLAFKVRTETYDHMGRVFDRPKPSFTLRSMEVIKARSKFNPSSWVGLAFRVDKRFEKALAHQFTGGNRAWKRAEGAFMRAGILPSGLMMVPSKECPLDQYGNIPASFLVRLISYLQAFGETGYKANMTQEKKGKLAKRKRTKEGWATINGVEYFVSYGRGRTRHLPKGIYAKTGIHGFIVKPILLFVRRGRYDKRIDLKSIGEKIVNRDGLSLLTDHLARGVSLSLGDPA
jgi:hypothetical protein